MSKHNNNSVQPTNNRSGEGNRGTQNNSDNRGTAKDNANQAKRQMDKSGNKK